MSRRHNKRFDNERRLNRRQWLSAIGIAGVAGLAGCTDEEPADEGPDDDGDDDDDGMGSDDDDEGIGDDEDIPDVSGTYDTVTSAGFTTLNPIYNSEAGAGTAIGRALDQGYTFDADQEFFPLLYDMETEDGEVWTFTVRENLEFSDPYGQCTAEDFVYLIQEIHQSEWANSVNSANWTDVEVTQTGEFTFEAELPNPDLLYPESFDPLLYPIPKGLLEPYVEDEDAEGLQQDEELLELEFTGNLGPFVMDEWNRGDGTVYSRNEDYYVQGIDEGPSLFAEAPYFEGASISIVEEQASRLGALETGEADAAAIPPERYEEYVENEDVTVRQVPQPYNEIISVNMRDNGWNAGPGNLFRHVPFRQALASAIGKRDLIDGVYRGLAEPHYTWQPRFSEFYPGDDELTRWGMDDQYGSDVARGLAEDAFAESEYDYSFDGGDMVNPDGDQVELDIYHSAGQEVEQLTAEYVAQELDANLGIDVTVEAIDGTRFDTEYWNMEAQGGTDTVNGEEVEWDAPSQWNGGPQSVTSNEGWDMSLVFGLNTYPRNPLTGDVFFDGANALYNPVGYYPGFDAEGLFEQARTATDRDELQEALNELFLNLNEEQPYIMLLFDDSLTGYNPDLRGPIENFSNGWDLPSWHFDD